MSSNDFQIVMAVLVCGTAYLLIETLRVKIPFIFKQIPDPPQVNLAVGMGIFVVCANAITYCEGTPSLAPDGDGTIYIVLALIVFYILAAIQWAGVLILRRLFIRNGWIK